MKKIFSIISVLIGIALILAGLLYLGVLNVSKQQQYSHPTIGFIFNYPQALNLETPTLPDSSDCPTEPCFIVLKNPSYNNEAVNWIFAIPISLMGGDKAKLQESFDQDVSGGLATAETINGIKMNKYVNDPSKPVELLLAFYQALGIDSSGEQSMYLFIAGDSGIMVGFRAPPTGAPANYKDYLNIRSWKNSPVAEAK
jgi:hypothetical protein